MFSVSTLNFPALQSDLLQQELFDRIRVLLPANLSLVEEISSLLRISNDSAYRRIRGEKSISFAELQTLSTHYRISLDSILKIDSRSSVFYGNWVQSRGFNFKSYLSGLLEHSQQVEGAINKSIYFEAKDLLPFEYLSFPELSAFKYFFWIRSVVRHQAYASMSFEDHDLSEVLNEMAPKLTQTYFKIPSVELWSSESINSTLNQIAYYKRSGLFRKAETVDRLYTQLLNLLDHVEQQAAAGEKLLPGGKKGRGASFKLYLNEAYLGHNTTLTEADGLDTVFVNHCVLNMMMTHDPDFAANTRKYFEETTAHSVQLNGVNEGLRISFFEGLKERVEAARNM